MKLLKCYRYLQALYDNEKGRRFLEEQDATLTIHAQDGDKIVVQDDTGKFRPMPVKVSASTKAGK